MKDLPAIQQALETPSNVFLVTHQKPDGDAMGSMLALYHLLSRKGHSVTAVSPTDFGTYLNWMPGVNVVLNYQKQSRQVLEKLDKADCIICLDFNHPDRINGLGEHVVAAKATTIVIDHHTNPHEFPDYIISDTSSCATAELLYRVIEKIWGREVIDKTIATCIYTGIVTDSGSFRYDNVTLETHQIAGYMIECGIDNSAIHRNLFDNNPMRKLKFFGYCLSEKLVVMPEYQTAYIHVSHEEIKKYNITTGETEGLVNYPLSIEGVIFAALIIDREKLIKISFRSIGNYPANDFASRFFSGGGHFNAAGGSSNLTLEKTVQKFEEKVRETHKEYTHA